MRCHGRKELPLLAPAPEASAVDSGMMKILVYRSLISPFQAVVPDKPEEPGCSATNVESTPVDVSQNYPSPSFQKLLTAS